MPKDKPFIYVAALRRTGSSVLKRALSLHPYSFVFQEPKFTAGTFRPKEKEIDYFTRQGVDLRYLVQEFRGEQPEARMRYFAAEVMPQLKTVCDQIGIKEIRHKHWQEILRVFPDARVLITARDPRDIYISLYYRLQRLISNGKYDAKRLAWLESPKTLAEELLTQFEIQKKLIAATDCFCVKYEDFCTKVSVFKEIKKFVGSDFPGCGDLGELNKHHRSVHGTQITNLHVDRWRRESNRTVIRAANQVYEYMGEYRNFWGY